MKMPLLYKILIKAYFWLEDFISRRVLYYLPKWFSQVHPKNLFDYRTRHFLEKVRLEDCVADLGAGTGRLAAKLAGRVKSVLAVDWNIPNRSETQLSNLEWIQMDVTDPTLPEILKKRGVRVVVLSHILEHIKDPIEFLRPLNFVDRLLICVPSMENWRFQIKMTLGLNPLTDNTHFREYTIEMLKGELAASGYVAVETFYNSEGEIFGVFKPA